MTYDGRDIGTIKITYINFSVLHHQQTLRQLPSLGSSVQTAIESQKPQLSAGQDGTVQASTRA